MSKILNIILIIIIILESLLFWAYIENHQIEITVNHVIELDQDLSDINAEIGLTNLIGIEDKINEAIEWISTREE